MKNQRFENEPGGGGGEGPVPPLAGEERAKEWLKRGQACAAAGTREGRREAVRCQDEALAAAAGMPGGGDVVLVARIWMNRGNALLGLASAGAVADPEAGREAVRSYDQALGSLGDADGVVQATAERGMMAGAAWLNRAQAVRMAVAGEMGLRESEACLVRAIARLTPLAEAHAPARLNLTRAWMNRASWLRAGGDVPGALAACRRVVQLAAGEAGRDASMLELALRARHALCVEWKTNPAAGGGGPAAAVDDAEAVEQVEAGLAEFAAWRGGAEGSRAMAARLFDFGAWLYRTRRLEQLAGFLARHADPADPQRIKAARTAIHLVRQEIGRMNLSELVTEAGEARRALLAALSAVETRLGASAF